VYQTFELGPSESAKPVTLGSFQVALAPGAPGADPCALAGTAVSTPAIRARDAPATGTASSPARRRYRRDIVPPGATQNPSMPRLLACTNRFIR
jgi:hypothetical protein